MPRPSPNGMIDADRRVAVAGSETERARNSAAAISEPTNAPPTTLAPSSKRPGRARE